MSLNRKAMVLAVGAALAAPSAYSQTSDKWEIYGKFYPELTHASGEGATAAGTTVSTLQAAPNGNGAITNRWEMQVNNTYIGFRGQRDLGRGLKAIGQLEQSISLDEGTTTANTTTGIAPSFGNRDSFVGLETGWGTVRLGNMDTPFKRYGDTLGFLGVGSGNFVSPNNVIRRSGSGGSSSASSFNLRRANAIDFASPTFGGLQVAVQLTGVYKIGVHSIEVDVNGKQYKETGATAANAFEEYKNKAYEVVWEARWTNQWRTALSYIKSAAGSCSVVNAGCSTNGLEGTQVNAGVAYFLDPSTYLFGLFSRLTNGTSARFNNSTQSPNAGEDITQVAFGISYSF